MLLTPSPLSHLLGPLLPLERDVVLYGRPLSSKLLRYKLISLLVKICGVVYVQIANISLASRLTSRSRSLTAVTSHRLAWEIRHTLFSVLYYICTSISEPLGVDVINGWPRRRFFLCKGAYDEGV